ncbi:SRPBCC family protein [Egibacter rhizosphaerae]
MNWWSCEVTVQIEIPASAAQVWGVLARPDRYPDWNPARRGLAR